MRITTLALAAALLLPGQARAAAIEATAVDVQFHIEHPAKKYDSKLLEGGGSATVTFDPADMSSLTLTTAIRVEMFNSDNARRDSHMIETLEGLVFPTIAWTVESVTGLSGGVKAGTFDITARGPMSLHGVTQQLEIPVRLVIDDAGHISADSAFSISLEAWGIERPTLLFIPIKDIVPIQVHMAFAGAGKFEFPEPPAAVLEGGDE